MPIYEYRCKGCGHGFEALVRRGDIPACPSCDSRELEQLLSASVVNSQTTRDQSLRAARRRDKAQGTERVQEQLKYERSHDD